MTDKPDQEAARELLEPFTYDREVAPAFSDEARVVNAYHARSVLADALARAERAEADVEERRKVFVERGFELVEMKMELDEARAKLAEATALLLSGMPFSVNERDNDFYEYRLRVVEFLATTEPGEP